MGKIIIIFSMLLISLIGLSQNPSITPSVTIQMNGVINVNILMIDGKNMGYFLRDLKIIPAFNYTYKVIDTVSFATVKCEDFKCPPVKKLEHDWQYWFTPDSVLNISIPCNAK